MQDSYVSFQKEQSFSMNSTPSGNPPILSLEEKKKLCEERKQKKSITHQLYHL